MTAVYVCEDCNGPAKWTILGGVVYYSCESLCAGFLQGELFPSVCEFLVGDEALVEAESSCEVDSRVSVSALDEATRGDHTISSSPEDFLP